MNGRVTGYERTAFILLRIVFIVAPIVAGLDKFFNLLTNWEQYLSPFALQMLNGHGAALMKVAGVIEIIAGLGVIWKPKVFAYIIAAWMLLVIINLLMLGAYYDIALRDFGLMLAAISLGALSHHFRR